MGDKCEHDKKAIFNRNSKILHKIYIKLTTYIKTTNKTLDHDNFNFVVQIVMRELNKNKLYGFEKKELCTQIIILLLDSLGLPHIINYYTVEAIGEAIEYIYNHNFHRFKKNKSCIIF